MTDRGIAAYAGRSSAPESEMPWLPQRCATASVSPFLVERTECPIQERLDWRPKMSSDRMSKDLLPTPDFTFDPDVPGACIAGVRPYRIGSYRLDAEMESGKFVVHNYGHGGAGITLSWGCAEKVREIVKNYIAVSKDTEVAVLGAGVMGLTAATLLLDLGLKVTIYSDRKPEETTSYKAGGQWAVSVVKYEGKEEELKGILKTAYTTFKNSIGKNFGVYERPNYTATLSHNLEVVMQLVPGLIPERVPLPCLPFEGHTQSGYMYQTLLIEPPTFLARLEKDLKMRNVTCVHKRFMNKSDVFTSVTQAIIVNCTGLGAKKLWNDSQLLPIKGQLAMLPPQPKLQYLYGQNGYMFPRSDHVVIGGTFEEDVDDEIADKAKCQELVDYMASLFGKAPRRAMPDFHIHHPRHAAKVNPVLPEVV
ncbi:FAD-dependent oxidoreductase [Streptosporangium sp. KLBMP 9127]|nr:FAD-binding oxidoreductase [Streptosporangium sp. KLBMP 9127]